MKRLILNLGLTMTFIILSYRSFGQSDNCSSLLQYGIYNEVVDRTSMSDYKQKIRNICDILDSAQKKISSGSNDTSIGIDIFNFGSDKSYSQEEITLLKKVYCEQKFELSDVQNYKELYSRIIDPNILKTYLSCIEANEVNKRDYNVAITVIDPQFSSVVISVTNINRGKTHYDDLVPFNVDESKFKILDGELFHAAQQRKPFDREYSLHVERIINHPQDFIISGNKKLLAPSGIIAIQFSSFTIPIVFPEITLKEEPTYIKSPMIGEIITSILEPDKFFQLYDKDEWMLANGKPVPQHATVFKEVYGEKTPDLRGVFLRGKNYGVNSDRGNPDGDYVNGTFQLDGLKNHEHPLKTLGLRHDNLARGRPTDTKNYMGAEFSSLSGNDRQPPDINSLIKVEPVGGHETRPKNVTVTFYVRVAVKEKEEIYLSLQ